MVNFDEKPSRDANEQYNQAVLFVVWVEFLTIVGALFLLAVSVVVIISEQHQMRSLPAQGESYNDQLRACMDGLQSWGERGKSSILLLSKFSMMQLVKLVDPMLCVKRVVDFVDSVEAQGSRIISNHSKPMLENFYEPAQDGQPPTLKTWAKYVLLFLCGAGYLFSVVFAYVAFSWKLSQVSFVADLALAQWTTYQGFLFVGFSVQVMGITRPDQEMLNACKYLLFVAGNEEHETPWSSQYEADVFGHISYTLYQSVGFLKTALFVTTLSYQDLPILLKEPADDTHEM